MEGKTKIFSMRLKQFDGLTRLIWPLFLRQIYTTDQSVAAIRIMYDLYQTQKNNVQKPEQS